MVPKTLSPDVKITFDNLGHDLKTSEPMEVNEPLFIKFICLLL